jgi:hypothetical protein
VTGCAHPRQKNNGVVARLIHARAAKVKRGGWREIRQLALDLVKL